MAEEDTENGDFEEEVEEEEEEEEEGGTGRAERPQRTTSSDRGPARRRFGRRSRVCQFCADKVNSLDYKQVDLLRRYVSEQGKIRPRRETGTCSKHQRMLARTVKRARHMALLPYAADRFR